MNLSHIHQYNMDLHIPTHNHLMILDQDIELNPAALFTWLGTQTSVSLSAFAAQPLTCSPVMSGKYRPCLKKNIFALATAW